MAEFVDHYRCTPEAFRSIGAIRDQAASLDEFVA
jgi:hypothetical protein